ncbi:DUF7511 domain-containing protein [Halorientalis sp.]|jgi:hypothetical protein|uniref:DUF7511 domain-containing protein n=1 Tax=Halorientalis sp. TaxID=1931229 RepID=UPI00260D0976|nr:hypothetical protein [Halorientalis sp.]
MSVVENAAAADDVQFDQLPEFDLECMYDDWDEPTEVTIFSTADGDSLYTAWLTANRDYAVSLADVR